MWCLEESTRTGGLVAGRVMETACSQVAPPRETKGGKRIPTTMKKKRKVESSDSSSSDDDEDNVR